MMTLEVKNRAVELYYNLIKLKGFTELDNNTIDFIRGSVKTLFCFTDDELSDIDYELTLKMRIDIILTQARNRYLEVLIKDRDAQIKKLSIQALHSYLETKPIRNNYRMKLKTNYNKS
jgi:hypothetical protein